MFLNTNGGLVKFVVIILVALLALAYFGFNLRGIAGSPTFQDNWAFIKESVLGVWNTYLKGPATYLWGIFYNLIWSPAIDNLQRLKNNEPDSIRTQAPKLNTVHQIP